MKPRPALNPGKIKNKRADSKQVVSATWLKARYTEVVRLRHEVSRVAAQLGENRLAVWRTLN